MEMGLTVIRASKRTALELFGPALLMGIARRIFNHLFVFLNRNFNLEVSAIRSLRANIPETPVVLLINEQGKSLWARWAYRHLRGPMSQV